MAGKRAKHKKSSYEKIRDTFREQSPRHVVTFEVDAPEDFKRKVFHDNEQLRRLGNKVTAVLRKRSDQMFRTKEYRGLQAGYGKRAERLKNLTDKTTPEADALGEELGSIAKRMTALQESYGVTWQTARDLAKELASEYDIQAVFALTRAEDIWRGMESILFKNGEHLHFHSYGDLPIMRAKQINRGIIIRFYKETGRLQFSYDGTAFDVFLPEKDLFLLDEYRALCDFMSDQEQTEEAAVNLYGSTGVLAPVFRPCFAAFKCMRIRGKMRLYIQITVAAEPLPKKDRKGNPRRHLGRGRVGVDIGTQSVATVSDKKVQLDNLAERNHVCTKEYACTKAFLLQVMDRSRRANNPERFNADGTIKKKVRTRWKLSKRYRKVRSELKELERRNAASRKYAIQEYVNSLREQADICITEPKNASKLKKRARKTSVSSKTIEVTTASGEKKVIHPFNRKKRFGKSILHRNPGYFQAQLKLKFGSGYHEVPATYRASQYDHILNTYIKKKLSQRWHYLTDTIKLQRDIYSAFLLYCADHSYQFIDQEACLARFDTFFKRHEQCIAEIVLNGYPVCNSGIRVA